MDLDVFSDVMIATLPVISVGVTYALTAVGVYLSGRYRSNKLIGCIVILDQLVIEVVKELNQTVVYDLKIAKADGKLTPEEAEWVKKQAVELIMKRFGFGMIRVVEDSLGPVTELVATKIEAAVHDIKQKKGSTHRRLSKTGLKANIKKLSRGPNEAAS